MCRHLLAMLLFAAPAFAQEGRTKTRLLYSFETAGEASRLSTGAENSTLGTVQDNGVTHGKNCARWVVKKASGYGVLYFDAASIKKWRDFDYLAIDVYVEEGGPKNLVLELWDAASKNYATRCTFEDHRLRAGRQTLLFPINRARRNGKEGRSWEELEPKDKINLDALTRVKLFIVPPRDRPGILWIDNVRLMQEDAAKPKLKLPLPVGAIGYKFGSAGEKLPGFTTVSPVSSNFTTSKGLTHGGMGWPDAVTGTYLIAPEGQKITFKAKVKPGTYRYWLAAGMILRNQPQNRRFLLAINDTKIIDADPSAEVYCGEKYLFRFLNIRYSAKPHAIWNRYIDAMYPVHTGKVKLADGQLTIEAVNHFLGAVVLVPEGKDFDAFAKKTKQLRQEAFARTLPPAKKPAPIKSDKDFLLYEPAFASRVVPSTRPTVAQLKKILSLSTAGAPGQRVSLRVAVTPAKDLDLGVFEVAAFTGPVRILASTLRLYTQEYRFNGEDLSEMALIPGGKVEMEAGVTRCVHVWLTIPKTAKAGKYKSTWTFRAGKGKPVSIPVELEVYPFALEEVLPLSLGMYYNRRYQAGLSAATNKKLLKEQLQFMREVGFTATSVGAPLVTGVSGADKVSLRFDPTMYELAREVDMGKHPMQYQMGTTLGVGRAIGRRLPGSRGAMVDRQPGIELKQPNFRNYFLSALKQQRDFIKKMGLPVAVEVVDEPREVPNPWNRNLADTITYAKMVREAGLTGFVTPMADNNGGKDYTVLADHVDIVSVHAWKASAGLMKKAKEKKRILWLYNTGMDRFSWGFYAWRVGAVGRWEWHFCWPEDQAHGGYPGRDWYNPFTASHGAAPYAPATYPGGMLFQSTFLDVSEGITDYAYLLTLEKMLIKRTRSKAHAKVVGEARKFLAALKGAIPEFPNVKGLGKADDGALVGMGLDDEARLQTAKWRGKIAGYLKELAKD